MARKQGLDFKGISELSEKYEKLGGELQTLATEALEFIPDEINPKLHVAMAKHRKTGKTEATIVQDQKVVWSGLAASISVGFDIKKGGLPSIFLMYGTPRHAPRNQYGGPSRAGAREHPGTAQDIELYDAIYGKKVQNEIAKKQQEIFEDAIAKLMK